MEDKKSDKKIAILQSDYIPWKGYFDLINSVDEFVIYDDAQYTKRDWRNRNLVKSMDGLKWLTIPVEVKDKFRQKIRETKIADRKWPVKHIKTIMNNYSKASCYNDTIDWIHEAYMECERKNYLSEINAFFLHEISNFLGITTRISYSEEFKIEGNRSDKILNICMQAGAGEYLSGPSAKSYLDVDSFDKAGIKISWMDYSGYREYPQLYPPFIHEVSVLDLIFNTGKEAVNYLNSSKSQHVSYSKLIAH